MIRKETIEIPRGIEYISQWKDYNLPRGEHCIVDKGVTGCGYTEFCLTNQDNVILCSPRKLLLENKAEQHENDENIIYLENIGNDYLFEKSIIRHLERCKSFGSAIKFMVTYDSLHLLTKCLRTMNLLEHFIFVVDEFQSIFLDSYFKAEVELDFISSLQDCSSVIYLSATPMLDKYLNRIPEFQNLKFYYLDWGKTGYVETVIINRKRTCALSTECCFIIDKFLKEDFPIFVDGGTGEIFQSKEAVFYFNSLSEILRVIRKCKLTPENTLIVCSKTEDNRRKLKKEGFTFGKIPTKNEPNPMFTFCTSAVYMGVDFYSECATSYIFADPNIDCLALDISLDLPQIIGRQRNKNNPFKNSVVVFYKTIRDSSKIPSRELFDLAQENRRKSTKNLLDLYETATNDQREDYIKKLKSDIEVSKYSNDFVGISKITGKPVYNSLIDISFERAWDVSQKDYQDSLSVTKAMLDLGLGVEEFKNDNDKIIDEFIKNTLYSLRSFREKLKLYCEFRDKYADNISLLNEFDKRTPTFRKYLYYYNFYGTEGCRSRSYEDSELKAGMRDHLKKGMLSTEIDLNFREGDKITMVEAKEKLKEIYKRLSISKTPKATDLKEYFLLSKTKIQTEDGIKHGFKLGKKLN